MRTVQTVRDAELIINRLLDDMEQMKKDVKKVIKLAEQEEDDEIKIERKFFDIANEVEFMRELNLVVHRLHHKFKRIVVEGETRWYDFLGRTPAQWYSQFAVIPDSNNSSLFLRDSANNPIWEIVRKVAGFAQSNWVMYTNLMPPGTNPVTSAGRFNLGGSDFRWDQIYARVLDLDHDVGYGNQLKVKAGGQNTIGLFTYDASFCGLTMGMEWVPGGSWVARSSAAWLFWKESSGDLTLYGNVGLTSGVGFSPSILWKFTMTELLPSGDKNIGRADLRIATYFGKYMELNTPISDINTQFAVKTGDTNAISLVSFDAATCGVSFGAVYTGGNWIAQSSTAILLQKTTNSFGLYMNNGLGVGGSFSPTLQWQFDGAGNFIPALGQSIGNTSFRVGTLYATNLNLSSGISTSSAINATSYQISGVTVIDSGRQFTGTNIGLTGPGNFASQGYVQADGGFRVSASLGKSTGSLSYRKGDGTSIGFLTFVGGILTDFS